MNGQAADMFRTIEGQAYLDENPYLSIQYSHTFFPTKKAGY